MNRREFLHKIGAGAIVIGFAPQVLLEPIHSYDAWMEATMKVLGEVQADMIIYGTGAYRYTDIFPWIERVPLQELYIPLGPSKGGLLDPTS